MGAKKLSADDKRALADRDYWVAMERNGWAYDKLIADVMQ